MSEYILETKGLTKHYGGVHALVDANFTLERGEHVAIMGDNGVNPAGQGMRVNRGQIGVGQRHRINVARANAAPKVGGCHP